MSEQTLWINGINARTGRRLLPPISRADLASAAQRIPTGGPGRSRRTPVSDEFFVLFDRLLERWHEVEEHKDGSEITSWSVIFADGSEERDRRRALEPLLEYRSAQIGERVLDWTYNHEEPLWTQKLLDPLVKFRPEYVLIVGGPTEIPFAFQQALGAFTSVGRLHFEKPTAYGHYAETVVKAESEPWGEQSPRNVVFMSSAGSRKSRSEQRGWLRFLSSALEPVAGVIQGKSASKRALEKHFNSPVESFWLEGQSVIEPDYDGGYRGVLGGNWKGEESGVVSDNVILSARQMGPEEMTGYPRLVYWLLGSWTVGISGDQGLSGSNESTKLAVLQEPIVTEPAQWLLGQKNGAATLFGCVGEIDDGAFEAHQDQVGSAIEGLQQGKPAGRALHESFGLTLRQKAESLLAMVNERARSDPGTLAEVYLDVLRLRSLVLMGDPAFRIPRDWRSDEPGARPSQQQDEASPVSTEQNPVQQNADAQGVPQVVLSEAGNHSFLDEAPYQWNKPGRSEFHELLLSAYSTPQSARALLSRVGIPPHDIDWESSLKMVWRNILEDASRRKKLRVLVEGVLQDDAVAGFHRALRTLIDTSSQPPLEERSPPLTPDPKDTVVEEESQQPSRVQVSEPLQKPTPDSSDGDSISAWEERTKQIVEHLNRLNEAKQSTGEATPEGLSPDVEVMKHNLASDLQGMSSQRVRQMALGLEGSQYTILREVVPIDKDEEDLVAIEVSSKEVRLEYQNIVYRSPNLVKSVAPRAMHATPEAYGMALFNAIINDSQEQDAVETGSPTTLEGYRRAMTDHRDAARFQLLFTPNAKEVHETRWECLTNPNEEPLCVWESSPIFRRLSGTPLATRATAADPIKILVAISNPSTLGQGELSGLKPLSVEDERYVLEEALAHEGGEVRIKPVFMKRPVTTKRLTDHLREGIHILHLVAHGISRNNGTFEVILEDDDGEDVACGVKELTHALKAANKTLKLVVLASCLSAQSEHTSALQWLGPRLGYAGNIPAVIAMQDRVTIKAMQVFSKQFYRSLFRTGRVDDAVASARYDLYTDKSLGRWQWTIPSLMIRSEDGRLFDVPSHEPEEPAGPHEDAPGPRGAARDPVNTPSPNWRDLSSRPGGYGSYPHPPPTGHTEVPSESGQTYKPARSIKSLVKINPRELKSFVEGSSRMRLAREVYSETASALNMGQHIIFTGPPGTGKTTFAHDICKFAKAKHMIRGLTPATATSDWTTFDTVGGYTPTAYGQMAFTPGILLGSIRDYHWLVIDEINRAEIDKAFGELFTLLSGQAVKLPYSQGGESIQILPAREATLKAWIPEEANEGQDYAIHPNWRVMATMNVYDRAFLFDMSLAFMRRFAFVDLGLPEDEDYHFLIDMWLKKGRLKDGPQTVKEPTALELLIRKILDRDTALMKCRALGPAIIKDMIAFIADRKRWDTEGDNKEATWLCEAFRLFVCPQLDGLDRPNIDAVRKRLKTLFEDAAPRVVERLQAYIEDLHPAPPILLGFEEDEDGT